MDLKFSKKGRWAVWWYSGVNVNPSNKFCPTVTVVFREILEDGGIGRMVTMPLSLPYLGQFRIGTIWQNNRCQAMINLDTERFVINLDDGCWKVEDFEQNEPYPSSMYPLYRKVDKNKLLVFKTACGNELIIPCQEYFSRCYGHSQEIKRILMTHLWDDNGYDGSSTYDSVQQRVFRPLREPEEKNKWNVNLGTKLYLTDAVFAAHLKYDQTTQRACKLLNQKLFAAKIKTTMFPEIIPWHKGLINIEVEGLWDQSKKKFLGLRILGTSHPGGEDIYRQTENQNDPQTPNPNGPKGGWPGSNQRPISPPIKVTLTNEEGPDSDTETVEVVDLSYRLLGTPRKVIHQSLSTAKTSGQNGLPPTVSDGQASGDKSGTGSGLGGYSSSSSLKFEGAGTLKDVWLAIQKIQRPDFYTNKVTDLKWHIVGDSSNDNDLVLSRILEPTEEQLNDYYGKIEDHLEDDNKAKLIRARKAAISWCSINDVINEDGIRTSRSRGILVLSFIIDGTNITLVEIERKTKLTEIDPETKEVLEQEIESFTCLAMAHHKELDIKKFINLITSKIGINKGVFSRIIPSFYNLPQKIVGAWPHKVTSWEEWPQEGTVKRILKNVGIELERIVD